jgi:hypothetical protein
VAAREPGGWTKGIGRVGRLVKAGIRKLLKTKSEEWLKGYTVGQFVSLSKQRVARGAIHIVIKTKGQKLGVGVEQNFGCFGRRG